MIKLSTLVISLALSTAAIAATESNPSTTNDWQSSLAAEFSKLDASGNGLLMPLEASRGKAFNKKSFAAADADKDGTLDQAEYINHIFYGSIYFLKTLLYESLCLMKALP